MNIFNALAIFFLFIFIVSFVSGILVEFRHTATSENHEKDETLISGAAVVIVVSSLILFVIFATLGHIVMANHHDNERKAFLEHNVAFDKASFSVFQVIRDKQDGLPSGGVGKIFLQGSNTVVVNMGNGKTSKGFKASNTYPLAVALPSDNYTLDGSVSASSNHWCFKIKEGERVAYYNQDGLVIENIATALDEWRHINNAPILRLSTCLNGVAYGSDGKALL